MLAYEVRVNDEPPVTVGDEKQGLLMANVLLVHRGENLDLTCTCSALTVKDGLPEEDLLWRPLSLQVGDTLTIKIVEATTVAPVDERKPARK